MKIIVLEIQDYKDNDVIINGISETGPVSFKVRGIKKPNSAFTWLNNALVVADVDYVENVRYRHQILKNAKLISYPIKDNTVANLFSIGLANEVMRKMILDEDKHKAFHYLEGFINAVKNYKDPLLSILIFLGKMMKIAGFALEVNQCVYCGSKKDIVAFSFAEGGFICRNCLSNDYVLDLNKSQMKLVRYIINKVDYLDLPNEKVDLVDKKILLSKFYSFIKDANGADLTAISTILKQDF